MEKITFLWLWKAIVNSIIGIGIWFNWEILWRWPIWSFHWEAFKTNASWIAGMIFLLYKLYDFHDTRKAKKRKEKQEEEIRKKRIDEFKDIFDHFQN